jgi:uncharacterized protein YjbI with pentapeptide repeats
MAKLIPPDWAAARGAQQFIQGSPGRGLNLRGADLSDIRVERVDLTGADLREADLEDFRALDCQFVGVNFIGAALKGARFFDCVMASANFSDCLMNGTMMSACSLMSSSMPSVDLRNADVLGTVFDGCNLVAADLRGVGAKQASFDGADLSNADLRSGSFERVSFRGANLTGVRWDGANLKGARFDPGSGSRMLSEARSSLPERDPAAYAALACCEGDRRWYSIERRATATEVIRAEEPIASEDGLTVPFERIDELLSPLACYALIVEQLLDSLLAGHHPRESRLTFSDLRTDSLFYLPG